MLRRCIARWLDWLFFFSDTYIYPRLLHSFIPIVKDKHVLKPKPSNHTEYDEKKFFGFVYLLKLWTAIMQQNVNKLIENAERMNTQELFFVHVSV